MTITHHQLTGYVGQSIGDLCPNGYTSLHDFHSTHFVAHALGYRFGVTCQMMTNGPAPGATLRLEELFDRCRSVGAWSLRPASARTCLVFITRASNVNLANRTIANVPRKHVGIFAHGAIWHYSHSVQKVVRQLPAQFAQIYPFPDNAMFFGTLP